MRQEQIDLVRRFNRAITQRIGALDDAYLSRGRSLGLSRLLWEIGPAGCEVRLLRARLGLDSGYLSRQLRRLEADRLVITDPDDGDARVRKVRLTRILRLETNRSLFEAKHLYQRAGFVEVEPFNNEPYAHHWFQKYFRHM